MYRPALLWVVHPVVSRQSFDFIKAFRFGNIGIDRHGYAEDDVRILCGTVAERGGILVVRD